MCCGYGVWLQSRQNFFRSPLSEFSESTPGHYTTLIGLVTFPTIEKVIDNKKPVWNELTMINLLKKVKVIACQQNSFPIDRIR